MSFQAARCPNCSGELRLDPSIKSGFCMHCGCEIIVEEAIKKVQIDHKPLMYNYMQLSREAYNRGDNREAYHYYTKVLEIDPNQWEASYYRGLINAERSTLSPILIMDAIQGADKALSLLSNDVKSAILENVEQKKLLLKMQKYIFANDINRITERLFEKSCERYLKYKAKSIYSLKEHLDRIKNHFIPAVDYCLKLVSDEFTQAEIDLIPEVNSDFMTLWKGPNNSLMIRLLSNWIKYCSEAPDPKKMINDLESEGISNTYVRYSDVIKELNQIKK